MTKHSFFPNGSRALQLGAAFLCLVTVLAAAEPTRRFDVPAGDAAVTLKQAARQGGLEIVFPATHVRGVKTAAVKGNLTPQAALNRMLAGTELVLVQDAKSGALSVSRSEKNAPSRPVEPVAAEANQASTPQSPDAVVQLEEYNVTGSRIRGLLEGAAAQPMLTLDAAQIERTGAQSIGDLLRYIPQVSSFTLGQGQTQNQRNALLNVQTGAFTYSPGTTQITGTAGLVTATIRGAPAGATLLLIDGKRAPKNNQSRSGDGFDLNGIPLAAVERIEVLLDGASSLYGADAMGGVINVILKKRYSGTEVRVGYENTFDTDVAVRTLSVSHGFSVGQLRGLVTASFEDSNELMLRDRGFLASYDRRSLGGADYRNASLPGGAGRISRSGTVPIPGLTGTQVAVPSGTTGAAISVAEYAAAGPIADPFDAGLYSQYAASYRRSSFLTKLDYRVNDALELYASARIAQNRNLQRSSPILATNLSIPVGYPGNPFSIPVTLNKVFYDLQPERIAENDTSAFSLGATGRLPKDWRYDLSISRADSHLSSDGDAGPSITSALLTSAINAGQRPNLFYDSSRVANPNAPGVIEALTTLARDEEKAQTWSYGLQVDGPVYDLAAGPIATALGVEKREEYVDFPIRVASDTATAQEGRINVTAFFAEVNVPVFGRSHRRPLLEQLNVSGSFRQEDYGTGSTSRNPRAGLAWRPATWLLFRGSYGEGFKVPTLQQRTQPNTVTNSNTIASAANLDPQRGNTVNAIYPITRGGKSDLRSETSENSTFGVVAEVPPLKGLSLSFDWFDNVYNDRVGTLLFNQMALLYPERITRGPNLPTDPAGWAGPVTAADLRPINVAFSQTTGFDVGMRYDVRTSVGDVQAGVSGTKYTKNTFIPTPGGLPSPSVTTDSLPVQVNGNVFYTRGAFGSGVLATYRAANRSNIDRSATPSALRWDVQVSYDFAKSALVRSLDASWVRHLIGDSKLSVTLYNVLDTRPPFDDLFFPDNTVLDSRMRRYALSLRRTF
jgi:outer membrane receptor protein involved in Fe transport